MKNFYKKKRSAVVHREEVDLGDDFVNKVESHLRESIKLFSDRLQSIRHDDILSISGLGRPIVSDRLTQYQYDPPFYLFKMFSLIGQKLIYKLFHLPRYSI